jgi:hypothetical protein
MFKQLKKQWAVFRQAPPGKRFVTWHERSRKAVVGQGGGWRIFRIAGAIICIVFAVIGSLIPGLPGFVFLFVGAALLASESREIAKTFDWLELKLRALWPGGKHA